MWHGDPDDSTKPIRGGEFWHVKNVPCWCCPCCRYLNYEAGNLSLVSMGNNTYKEQPPIADHRGAGMERLWRTPNRLMIRERDRAGQDLRLSFFSLYSCPCWREPCVSASGPPPPLPGQHDSTYSTTCTVSVYPRQRFFADQDMLL